MGTEERREVIDIGLPGITETATPRGELPQNTPEFAPHEVIDLRGTLACGQSQPRSAEELTGLCLPALIGLIEQTAVWNVDSINPEERLGDYRFLVIEFTETVDICRYVQIWSEPNCDLTMEVGPGNREDKVLQAVADRMRPALIGRGLEIGGNANNFRKHLVAPSLKSASCIANEILALLTKVLDYKGTDDLTYHVHQDSHLRESHVLDGISRSQLFDWLNTWGLNPRRIDNEEDTLQARERDLTFRALLSIPKKRPNGHFWEIHCHTTFPLPSDAAEELLAEYSSKATLFKVFGGPRLDDAMREIGIATGINLAGGVTPAHIRSQIMEWLDAARTLRSYRAHQRRRDTS
jgi:hypothetical protein